MKYFSIFLFIILSTICLGQSNANISYAKYLMFNDSRLYQDKDTSEIVYNRYQNNIVSIKMYYHGSKNIHGEFIQKDASNYYFTEYNRLGNIITKGLVYTASKAFYTDTIKLMSPISLSVTHTTYNQYYRLKRTGNWEYFLVDSIHEKNIVYKNDTIFKIEHLNKINGLSNDSLSKKLMGLWYAHIVKSDNNYILLTKNNKDYNFNFTSKFNPDFSYRTELRFIENKEEKGLNIGKWELNNLKTLHLNFENGVEQSYKIAYLTKDVIILNLN